MTRAETTSGAHAADVVRLHVAVAGFGLAGLFGKLIGFGPAVIVVGRTAFAALAIALVLALTGRAREILPGTRKEVLGLTLGLVLAAHWWTFFQAVKVAGVGIALVSFSVAPILLLAMEAAWHRRWPGRRKALASLLALAGVAVMTPSLHLSDTGLQGMLWGIASGATYALLVLLNRPLVAEGSPWRLTLWQDAAAALVLSPALAGLARNPSPREWILLAVLGTLLTAGTHGLFMRSIRTVPAHLAVLTCTLEPGYGMVAAALVLGEHPSPRTLLGALMIGAAVLSATLGPRSEAPRTASA